MRFEYERVKTIWVYKIKLFKPLRILEQLVYAFGYGIKIGARSLLSVHKGGPLLGNFIHKIGSIRESKIGKHKIALRSALFRDIAQCPLLALVGGKLRVKGSRIALVVQRIKGTAIIAQKLNRSFRIGRALKSAIGIKPVNV